jgi:putative toxin-antitoxin system antitoxin component (TIGR02293 family)
MVVAKKKVVVKKKVSPLVSEKEPNIRVRDIIANIGKWGVDQKIAVIKSGITKLELEKVKKETCLDYDLFSGILGITKATIHNKTGAGKFSSSVSEKILQLADVYSIGYDVFQEKDRFREWMKTPVRSTGGIPPVEYLKTYYGVEEIKNILGRIAWGIIS